MSSPDLGSRDCQANEGLLRSQNCSAQVAACFSHQSINPSITLMGEGIQQARSAGSRAGDTTARRLDPCGRHLVGETLPLPHHLNGSYGFTDPAMCSA